MGVCTVTPVKVFHGSDRKEVIADVTLSASYATGGDTLTAAMLGLDLELNHIDAGGEARSAAGTKYDVDYDYVNGKLLAFGTNAAPGAAVADVQVTAATNLSTFTTRVRAIGKGPAVV